MIKNSATFCYTVPVTILPQHIPKRVNNPHIMKLKEIRDFQGTIYGAYRKNMRIFPWRRTHDPYQILISEVMLQQTQAGERTVRKYEEFLKAFPTIKALAQSSFEKVFRIWQGLGYNRRAKALRDAARIIVTERKGKISKNEDELVKLPGIGPYTAAAVCAFAYQKPVVCLETNIRTVYLLFFFSRRRTPVSDKEIIPLIEETLDKKNVREWYYALMDYGAMLKKRHGNLNRKSRHYTLQSRFEGSDRQVRGKILRELSEGHLTSYGISRKVPFDSERIQKQVATLLTEGLIEKTGRHFSLAS